MKILIVIPNKGELDFFLQNCIEQGLQTESLMIGQIPVTHLSDLGLMLAQGGFGKVQYAIQTQHLIDKGPAWDVIICTGAAGALSDKLLIGDVVIGNEIIEYDIKNKFGDSHLPRFKSSDAIVDELILTPVNTNLFKVYVGIIASGDEDIIDPERRREVREITNALANSWEGVGGARACHFSGVPFVEVRGISDVANETAAQDFEKYLPETMKNVSNVIIAWARLCK